MKVVGLVSLLVFSFAACVAQAGVACAELKTGWRFAGDEPRAAMREFDIPSMIDWLDDMGRDLIETPCASCRPAGAEPTCPYAEPDFDDRDWEPVRVCDAQGRTCPTAKIPLKVTVSGGGEFVSAENGDESDFAGFRDPERKTFNGYLSVLVRRRLNSNEPIVVEASGSGLSGTCSF